MAYKIFTLLSVLFSLGRSNPIIAGEDVGRLLTSLPGNGIVAVGQDEFPFVAHVTIFTEINKNGLKEIKMKKCGGVIIAADAVLTAAHCIPNSGSVPLIYVRAGLVDIELELNTSPGSWASGCVINEGYIQQHNLTKDFEIFAWGDIAIVWLEKPFVFGPNIQKATLPLNDKPCKGGELGWILGWGINSKGVISNMLQKAQTRIVPYQKCQKSYPKNFISPDMLCLLSDTNSVSCDGDSGGPFVVGNAFNYTVYGIISVSSNVVDKNGHESCDPAKPEILTHIGMYRDWIEEKLTEHTLEKIPKHVKPHGRGKKRKSQDSEFNDVTKVDSSSLSNSSQKSYKKQF